MGDGPAETAASTRNSTSADIGILVGGIPVVGKFLAAFFDVSPKTRTIVIAVLFLLVVYPILSLTAALLIITKSPSWVQAGARTFVLSSIGVDDKMITNLEKTEDDKFNRSNQVIDASLPIVFSSDGPRQQFTEKVAADQRIKFDALIHSESLNKTDPTCITAERPTNMSFGTLVVTSYESGGQVDLPINLIFDRSFNVGTFAGAEWATFQKKSYSGRVEPELHLQISVTPDTALSSDAYLKCNRIIATVYMDTYKLPIDAKSA